MGIRVLKSIYIIVSSYILLKVCDSFATFSTGLFIFTFGMAVDYINSIIICRNNKNLKNLNKILYGIIVGISIIFCLISFIGMDKGIIFKETENIKYIVNNTEVFDFISFKLNFNMFRGIIFLTYVFAIGLEIFLPRKRAILNSNNEKKFGLENQGV